MAKISVIDPSGIEQIVIKELLDGEEMDQAELAARIGILKSTLSRTLQGFRAQETDHAIQEWREQDGETCGFVQAMTANRFVVIKRDFKGGVNYWIFRGDENEMD